MGTGPEEFSGKVLTARGGGGLAEGVLFPLIHV